MRLARNAATLAEAAQAEAQKAPPATPDAPDPTLSFTRLAASVRHAVALEQKIAEGAFARHHQAPQTPWHPEPDDHLYPDEAERPPFSSLDRGILFEATCLLTEHHPDQPALHQAIPALLETTLIAHPNDPLATNFARICEALNVLPDHKALPDYLESQLRPERWPK